MKQIKRLSRLHLLFAIPILAPLFSSCAMVHQKDREWLSDPVLQRQSDPLEGNLNGDNFPRREGSSGGSSGAGGGCGC